MQVIIPMTGYGSRFVSAGYKKLKPFIDVCGRSILDWIVNGMYPENVSFYFICRKEHLLTLDYVSKEIKSICPNGTIVEIDNWVKKGPVYDIVQAAECIDMTEPSIVNYCDFYAQWDYNGFCNKIKEKEYDGAVPCYTGFHPHLLPPENVYASCKVDADDLLIEIREKYSFSADKQKARHSPGIYYYKDGKTMLEYCKKLISSGPDINGEYYSSLTYNNMIKEGKKVWVPTNVSRFCQWGTPQDLEDFVWWARFFTNNANQEIKE